MHFPFAPSDIKYYMPSDKVTIILFVEFEWPKKHSVTIIIYHE